jgi:hypothetical protein
MKYKKFWTYTFDRVYLQRVHLHQLMYLVLLVLKNIVSIWTQTEDNWGHFNQHWQVQIKVNLKILIGFIVFFHNRSVKNLKKKWLQAIAISLSTHHNAVRLIRSRIKKMVSQSAFRILIGLTIFLLLRKSLRFFSAYIQTTVQQIQLFLRS